MVHLSAGLDTSGREMCRRSGGRLDAVDATEAIVGDGDGSCMDAARRAAEPELTGQAFTGHDGVVAGLVPFRTCGPTAAVDP